MNDDLWTCTRCALAPDPTWEIHWWSDQQFHIGFDGGLCGPIVANPATPVHVDRQEAAHG